MRGIAEFLERFRKLRAPERSVREALLRVVRDTVACELRADQVTVMHGSVRLAAPPAVKCEIQLHKKEILDLLRDREGVRVGDIL